MRAQRHPAREMRRMLSSVQRWFRHTLAGAAVVWLVDCGGHVATFTSVNDAAVTDAPSSNDVAVTDDPAVRDAPNGASDDDDEV